MRLNRISLLNPGVKTAQQRPDIGITFADE